MSFFSHIALVERDSLGLRDRRYPNAHDHFHVANGALRECPTRAPKRGGADVRRLGRMSLHHACFELLGQRSEHRAVDVAASIGNELAEISSPRGSSGAVGRLRHWQPFVHLSSAVILLRSASVTVTTLCVVRSHLFETPAIGVFVTV
jgi:hypothetical protein